MFIYIYNTKWFNLFRNNHDLLDINFLDVFILLQAVQYLAKQEMGPHEEVVERILSVKQMEVANQHKVPTNNLVQY